jgi:membrane protein
MRQGGWHQTVRGFVRRVWQAAYDDKVPFLASALAFDTLLAAIPFILLTLGILGYLLEPAGGDLGASLHEVFGRLMPQHQGGAASADAFSHVEQILADIVRNRDRLSAFGAPLFVWFSMRLFGSLRVALNEVFDTDESRPWPVAKGLDLLMVIFTSTMFLGNAILTGLVQSAYAGRLLVSWLAFLQSAVTFYVIFKVVPSRPIFWRTALLAASFCALAFEIAKRLFTLYLARVATLDRIVSDANVGALFLFVLWVYFMTTTFLIGGEVAETYDLLRMRRAQRAQLG